MLGLPVDSLQDHLCIAMFILYFRILAGSPSTVHFSVIFFVFQTLEYFSCLLILAYDTPNVLEGI